MLNQYLQVSLRDIQEQRLKFEKDVLKDLFGSGDVPAMLHAFRNFFSRAWLKKMEQRHDLWQAYQPQIENHSQAQAAFDRWLKVDSNGKGAVQNLFEEKLQRLNELEKAMKTDRSSSALATIEPESFFAVTYVLKFKRQRWEPKKYNIAIESIYSETGKDQQHIGGATTSLIITPAPITLTSLAIISSALGVLLKHTLDLSTQSISLPWSRAALAEILEGPQAALFVLHVISGFILALVFFNVYEHTELGKKIGLGVSWRSALLIGVLCGLLSDRVLGAVKAFVGA